MSRIGRAVIVIPDGVTITQAEGEVRVKGPKGQLAERMPTGIDVVIADSKVTCERQDDRKESRSKHGLARALVANMVTGVVKPFSKELEIQGVGYRSEVAGKKLKLTVGFSHAVDMPIPEGLSVSVDRNVIIKIEGISRQMVGQFAADVRSVRPPEPYKGKGIRYLDERVRRKVGKAGTAGAG
jgi:large subunit ribosomal protein L6